MRALQHGLVAGAGAATLGRAFYWNEAKTMFAVGWPMLVSFFCRIGMASEDSAFVGHLSQQPSLRAVAGAFPALQGGLLTLAIAAALGYSGASWGPLGDGDGEGYGPGDFLAAAGLSDMVINIIIIPPLAFNMSLNALVSQAIGSGNKKMAGTWLQLSLIWLTIGYLPLTPLFFYVGDILKLLGFSARLCHLAGSFAKWNAIWPIPNGWYQCMRFYFQAQGISRPAMYNNLAFLGVNAFLNWVFVFGGPLRGLGFHGFGFVGSALSLSTSRSLQPLAYWLYMFAYRRAHADTWPSWGSRTYLRREHLRSFMAMALPQVGTLVFQAVIGQATTLLIARLGKMAIASSAAAAAATQMFTSGLTATLSAVGGMRVGFYLGKGEPQQARSVALLSLALGGMCTGMIGIVLASLGRRCIAVITDDEDVQDGAVSILPAVLLNLLGSVVVQVGTGGILTSQGRTKMVTALSMGFELPLSLGSTALLVMAFHATLTEVYWVQAVVTCFEALVVGCILQRSNWRQYAREARARQLASALPDPGGAATNGDAHHGAEDERLPNGVSLLEVAAERVVTFTVKDRQEIATESQWQERVAALARQLGTGAELWEACGDVQATDADRKVFGDRATWAAATYPLQVQLPMRRRAH